VREAVYFEGCYWVKAHVPPGMSDAPRLIPLCPYCWDDGRESEARPSYTYVSKRDAMVMDRDPVFLQCSHPKHAETPFEATLSDERYEYATLRMGREEA